MTEKGTHAGTAGRGDSGDTKTTINYAHFYDLKYKNPHLRKVLVFIVTHPGARIRECEDSLGGSRGRPDHLTDRQKVAECIGVLELFGYLAKKYHRYFPTKKADLALLKVI